MNVNNLVTAFNSAVNKPERYLQPNEALNGQIKEDLKHLYDFTQSNEPKGLKSNALPELIIENFDNEQIWQQIELKNNDFLENVVDELSRLLVHKEKLLFKDIEDKYNVGTSNADLSGDERGEVEDKNEKIVEEEEGNENDELDDNFGMEEEDVENGNQEVESESDEELSDDLEDEDDSGGEDKMAMYKDFFKEAPNEEETEKYFDDMDSDDEKQLAGEKDIKSTFEARQERLQKKIEEIEESAVAEKPWQLKGEVTAETRPHNALLEEMLEFDLSKRPAPVMTEKTTKTLEDIIRQRIKDKAFDSVVRKERPVDTPVEYKKKLLLDQEKSKLSLAQIYEKEYLDQQAALDPNAAEKEEEEPVLHKEVNKLMKELFVQLDALSNFHFTPKPAVPELKVISNVPVIAVEEVAPVAVHDAELLAPQEIKKQHAHFVGKTERTKTDMNRDRRKKKLKQKIHAKRKGLTKELKHKNTKKVVESSSDKHLKSSTRFFEKLTDTMHSNKQKDKKKNH